MRASAAASDAVRQLSRRMAALGLKESDFEESFVRSSGPGGQNVNKTATCVVLVHRPSGMQVRCQSSRQQGFNRFLARVQMVEKLEAVHERRLAAERALREKTRRQSRQPSRAAKQRMLADKARRAARKANRRAPAED